jgi:hypothetical protein
MEAAPKLDRHIRMPKLIRTKSSSDVTTFLIELTCYSQLMEDLAFDQPETKLALPRFFVPEKQEKNDDSNAQPPHPVPRAHRSDTATVGNDRCAPAQHQSADAEDSH